MNRESSTHPKTNFGIGKWSEIMQKLEKDPTQTIIRGSLTEGKINPVPRNKDICTATPRQWCMIDIDSLAWDE